MNYYSTLLTGISKVIKIQGFNKRGNTFYLFKNNNWGLINFQKSTSSDKLSFTINIGVVSTLLKQVIDKAAVVLKPDINDCHWKKRIGFLLPEKKDHWWTIDNNTSIENLVKEISYILETLAIPELINHLSNDYLEQEWSSGKAEGATQLQRYIYLTTLLKINNNKKFLQVLEEFKAYSKGKPYEYTAQEHINNLQNYE